MVACVVFEIVHVLLIPIVSYLVLRHKAMIQMTVIQFGLVETADGEPLESRGDQWLILRLPGPLAMDGTVCGPLSWVYHYLVHVTNRLNCACSDSESPIIYLGLTTASEV